MRLILSEKDKHIIVTVLGDYATEIDRQSHQIQRRFRYL